MTTCTGISTILNDGPTLTIARSSNTNDATDGKMFNSVDMVFDWSHFPIVHQLNSDLRSDLRLPDQTTLKSHFNESMLAKALELQCEIGSETQ